MSSLLNDRMSLSKTAEETAEAAHRRQGERRTARKRSAVSERPEKRNSLETQARLSRKFGTKLMRA